MPQHGEPLDGPQHEPQGRRQLQSRDTSAHVAVIVVGVVVDGLNAAVRKVDLVRSLGLLRLPSLDFLLTEKLLPEYSSATP